MRDENMLPSWSNVKLNKKNMNTSKVMLDLIKLSDLINKIELQIKNIEMGDSHSEIGNLMNFPFKSIADNSDMRKEALIELHEMLYNAFVLICRISLATSDEILLSIVNKSCTSIIDLLLSCQLEIQKAPMINPLADQYREAIINLQQNSNDLFISDIKKLSNILYI